MERKRGEKEERNLNEGGEERREEEEKEGGIRRKKAERENRGGEIIVIIGGRVHQVHVYLYYLIIYTLVFLLLKKGFTSETVIT